MIFTGFQPNATKKDVTTALGYLLLPWKWGKVVRGGEYEAKACRILRKKFSVYHTYLFDSGRSALEVSLQALGVGEGDEVIVQAYTCVVVINAIKWVGAIPVYVDVRKDFNIDVSKIKEKISPKTKAIIAQHTFGIPCEIDQITHIAREHNLAVIEDSAHVIEGEYKGKKLGTYGDIGMFSFGTDKAISCGRGGALIAMNDAIGEKIGALYEKIQYPKRWWVLPYLWNFPLFVVGKALYKIKIGKLLLAALKKLSITGRVIYEKEKQGVRSHFKVSRLANSLCHILCNQLEALVEVNEHRGEIARWYHEEIGTKKVEKPQKLNGSFYVRYPVLVSEPGKVMTYFKSRGILLGDWYDTVIGPDDIKLEKTGYIMGSCPVAESLAKRSLNLPTSQKISVKHADQICQLLKKYYDSGETN